MPATPPATSAHTDIPAKSTDPVLLSGEGSVYRRGPGWEAAYHVDGRRRTFRAATSREARERLTEVLRKLERGETLRDERISVADYLEYWLAAIEPTIRPSTHKRYREYVRVHAIPEIGRIKMVQLSPMHLQGLYAKRLTAGSSPSTVHHLHRTLRRALAMAERWEIVHRNVASVRGGVRRRHRDRSTAWRAPRAPLARCRARRPSRSAHPRLAAARERQAADPGRDIRLIGTRHRSHGSAQMRRSGSVAEWIPDQIDRCRIPHVAPD